MSRRVRKPPQKIVTPQQQRLLDRINAAFNSTVTPIPSQHDTEDDEGDFEMVASVGGGASSSFGVGGGFDGGFGGGGGFVRDDEDENMEGGFMRDDTGGGFLLPEFDPSATVAPGGFFLDDEPSGSGSASMGGGGGFIPEDEDVNMSLPPLPPFPSPTPTANLPSRIPLHKIPAALSLLSLPPDSHDLLSLFKDVASDDEDGVTTVAREKFVEACAVLLEDDDEDSEESEEENDDEEEEDEWVDSDSGGKKKKTNKGKGKAKNQSGGRTRSTTRRSTRSNPNPVPITTPADDADLSAGPSSSSSEQSSDSEEDLPKSKGKGKAVQKRKKEKELSLEELNEIRETFELFFEGNDDDDDEDGAEKVIGLQELKTISGLLNEKLSDEDMMEMLEYAARSGGVVNLEAFTRLCAEAL